MKHRSLFLALIAAIAISITALIAFTSRASIDGGSKRPPSAEEAEQENPGEAERWEWMRLHDPATGVIPRDIARREGAFARTLPERPESGSSRGGGRSIASLPWIFRGPVNVGGRTRALAIDAADTNVLLAGATTGGMWRSVDGGASWSRRTPVDAYPGVTCIVQDRRPGKTDTWYYGTGEFRTNSARFGNVGYPGDGIYKSTDRGLSWRQLPATANPTPQSLDRPFDFVSTIVVDESSLDRDVLYAAAYGSIMRSTDGGESWATVLGGMDNRTGYSTVASIGDGILYAGLGSGGKTHGIYRSTDGITWTNITPATWGDSCKRIVIEISPSDEKSVYVLAETEGRGHIVSGSYGYPEYYSLLRYTHTNGDGSGNGGEWADLSDNLPSDIGPWEYNGLSSYAMLLRVDPTDAKKIWLGGSNLYRNDHGFTTGFSEWMGGYDQNGYWGQPDALHPDQHVLVFNPLNPRTVYVGDDGGIYRTRSADQAQPVWESLANAYVTSQFYTVAIDHGTPGSQTLMGGAQDNGTWLTDNRDATTPWGTPFGGDGSFCAIVNSGRDLYFSSQNGNIYRQNLDDSTYTRIPPDAGSDYLFIAPFAIDPFDENEMFLAAGRTLWRNTDLQEISFGDFGEQKASSWDVPAIAASQISAIGVSTVLPAHRVYYGTVTGKLYRIDDALDPTPTPVDVTGASFPAGAYINCVAVDPADGDRAMAIFTNYGVQSIFSTTDGGRSWSAVGGNLEEFADGSGSGPSCRWGAITHRGGNTRFFVATSVGLYSASALDGAATSWEQEGASVIGNMRVDMIDCRQSDGLVAVATWGRGIYTTTLPTSGVDESTAPVAGLSLEAPHPNPARDHAAIGFTLPSAGTARLTLFDPLGREVARIVDAALEAGPHQATLDLTAIPPATLPNGAYFYRLDYGGHAVTRGVIVER